MEIDLKGLTEGLNRLHVVISPADLDLEIPEISVSSPIYVELEIAKRRDTFVIEGWVRTSAVVECARCLDSFHQEIEETVALLVHRGAVPRVDDVDDEVKVIAAEAGTVDLSDEIRDAVLLSLPVKPLCSEECRGICPLCGQNLNREGTCGCHQEIADPRWEALRTIVEMSS